MYNSLEITPTQWHVRTTVLALHLLFIVLIWWGGYESQIKRAPQKLSVNTVALTPRPIASASPVAPTVAIAEEVSIQTPTPDTPTIIEPKKIEQKQIEPKKIEPKKVEQKKIVPKKMEQPKPAPAKPQKQPPPVKTPAEKAPDAKKSALVTDALSSLDRLSKRSAPPARGQKIAAPTALTTLSLDSPLCIEEGEPSMSPQERSYHSELVQRLKLELKLPEHGEVQVDLTLSRSGKVTCIKCIKFKSTKNAQYLEKNLKGLQFPPFGSHFPNVQEQTFHLQLRSDINY